MRSRRLSYTPLSIGSMKKPCTQAMTVTKIAMRCTMTSQKWRYCSRSARPVSSGSPISSTARAAASSSV